MADRQIGVQMPKRASFKDSIARMEPEARLSIAKECVKDLTYRVQIVLEAYATCEHVCYSDRLASRIPPSSAARSFSFFRDGVYHYMVIRLMALWDPPGENAVSIPQALALINESSVIKLIVSETYDAHSNRGVRCLNPSDDPEIQKAIEDEFARHQRNFALSQAEKAERNLEVCFLAAQEISDGEIQEGLRNLRDRVAHSVTQTRREIEGRSHRAKYGYERKLLERTVSLIEDLYCWVNGTSFDISGDCLRMAREGAAEFWGSIAFLPEGEGRP
jgi:hypothetical protein